MIKIREAEREKSKSKKEKKRGIWEELMMHAL